ncbi:MAG: TldD/PmbA family protein [Thermodesulfovibrionales bacterium]|nr:TldD/PmbA family protein [Thermodesulfovibrionales bacterium]
MLDPNLAYKILKKVLSRGGEFADIFCENKSTTTIQLEDDKIEKVLIGSDSGVGIRLILNKITAYAFSNDFGEKVLMDMADSVSKIAKDGSNKLILSFKKSYPSTSFTIKKRPDEVPVFMKIEQVKEANDVARKFDKKIKQVNVIYRDTVQRVSIFNSKNIFTEDERIYTTGIVHVVSSDGEKIQTGYEAIGGNLGFELFDNSPLYEFALIAAKRAIMMLYARRAPGGRMPVVISSQAGGTMIHEAIGHGLEADLVQQRLSVYSGKVGQKVASPVITVIDDGTMPAKRGSFSFDDEGTPSKRNILVKEGILQGYLYDIYTAMVDNVSSTGNGRRQSYEHKPIPRMTNTFLAPGLLSPEDVIKSVDKGLFVKKMGGGQVNTITGDFVFDVQEGYLIEDGSLGDAVRGATLIGNGPEILLAIDMVASDLGFSIGTCGKDAQGVPVSDGMPTLRIPEMVVGGEIER